MPQLLQAELEVSFSLQHNQTGKETGTSPLPATPPSSRQSLSAPETPRNRHGRLSPATPQREALNSLLARTSPCATYPDCFADTYKQPFNPIRPWDTGKNQPAAGEPCMQLSTRIFNQRLWQTLDNSPVLIQAGTNPLPAHSCFSCPRCQRQVPCHFRT